jgi:hypothetical protein
MLLSTAPKSRISPATMVSLDTERDEHPDSQQLVYRTDDGDIPEQNEDDDLQEPEWPSNPPSSLDPSLIDPQLLSGMNFLLFLILSCMF